MGRLHHFSINRLSSQDSDLEQKNNDRPYFEETLLLSFKIIDEYKRRVNGHNIPTDEDGKLDTFKIRQLLFGDQIFVSS